MKGNLLIVDDEKLIRENLSLLLEDYADEIFQASTGKSALKTIHDNPIHCVVCDIKMPEMSGVQLIKEIRKENQKTPFIFYTGVGSREKWMELSKYSPFAIVDKPLFDNLEDNVIKALHFGIIQDKQSEEDFKTHFKRLLDDSNDYS